MTRGVALVTGGGKRIGARIALRLARDGYDLAIHSHRPDPLEAGLAEGLDASGVAWRRFAADLRDAQAVGDLWTEAAGWRGPPTLLVNNAALFGPDTIADATAATLGEHHAINCLAPVLLAQAMYAAGGDGVVVNILDQRIAQPHGDQLSYTLSKLALEAATRLLARVLAPTVRVCGVAPGLTLAGEDYTATQLERLTRDMPLERLPSTDTIADAVSWLAGAGAVTGQILFVDGGAHMRSFARDFVFMHG